MIKKIGVVSSGSEITFERKAVNVIAQFQEEGFRVELQYSYNDGMFSAMIIGRIEE